MYRKPLKVILPSLPKQPTINQKDSNSVIKQQSKQSQFPAKNKNPLQIQADTTKQQIQSNKPQNYQNSNKTYIQITQTNTQQLQFQQNVVDVANQQNKFIGNSQCIPKKQVRGESLQQSTFHYGDQKQKPQKQINYQKTESQNPNQYKYQIKKEEHDREKNKEEKSYQHSINKSSQKQQQNIQNHDQQLQQSSKEYPIALFLGNSGVGKTSLIKIIFKDSISNLKEFQLYPAKIDDFLIYNFVDTKGFDFESNINEREEQIKLYQSIFYEYPNKVGALFVVVNFERTDLMKKKLLSIYKFFRKFSSIISIIVTEMQLSDNQNKSEAELKKNFAYFKPQNIIFVRRDTRRDELIQKLNEKSLNKIQANYEFNVTDTIFEKEDEQEMKKIQNQLMSRFIK
ncbi:unnamed protein product [Paramecium sonneborni]|uniref:P-loop containing nucleoside triphosphate hydrolase n=1 Tax=Paramecium sonneborni TaxID=65129 RepID=A0A8S1RQC1_9CILI|nr:unnamed protein product [Paramecium sonneborni]